MKNNFYTKNGLIHFFILIATYLIILGIRGFLFASNDVVDVMSYALYLRDSSLYAHDFYIQNIANTFPNERIIFASLLAFLGNSISWMTLILHAVFSLILISGIYRVASQFISTKWMRWLVPLVLLGPLYGIGPGDCELYYNMFIASLVAKSIGIWALYYFLKREIKFSYLLLVPVTFIHPTVGAQLFLIVFTFHFIRSIFEKKVKNWRPLLLFLVTAGTWLILMQVKVHGDSFLPTEQLFELFEFRLAHHFFPDYFKRVDLMVGLILLITAVTYFSYRKEFTAISFLLITFSGIIVYTLSHFLFPLGVVLSSQWFKSYIWIELLGVIALVGWIDYFLGRFFSSKTWNYVFSTSLLILGLLVFTGIHSSIPYFQNKKHDFFYFEDLSDEAGIAIKVRQKTQKNAVFVVPMAFTEFKYYSQRSLYIDYKSVVHRKDVLPEWYGRIKGVYDLDVQDRRSGEDLYDLAKTKYLTIDASDMERFRSLGIDYFVTYRGHDLSLEVVAENQAFLVYKL